MTSALEPSVQAVGELPGRAEPAGRSWPLWLKCFWLVVGGGLCSLWGLALVVRMQPPPGKLNDFIQEWASARNFWEGAPLYEDLATAVPRHLDAQYDGEVRVNAHPPTSILLALPFGQLGFRQSVLLWNALSLAALVTALALIRSARGLSLQAWLAVPVAAFVLTSNSLAQQVNQAQLNLLLLLIITLTWLAIRREQWEWAGALIAIGASIKVIPGFLVLYFLARRQWTAVLWFAGSLVAIAAFTSGILGWEAYRDYLVEAVPRVGGFRDWWPNASIMGFFAKLLDGSSGHGIPLMHAPLVAKGAAALCMLAVAGLVARQAAAAEDESAQDRAFATCVVAMVLVSPVAWDHYFLMLLLPFAVLWKQAPSRLQRGLIAALAIALCTIYPKWIWDATIPGAGELAAGPDKSIATTLQLLTVVSYQFYCLLALLAYCRLRPTPPHEASP